jgi:hypothetical protein
MVDLKAVSPGTWVGFAGDDAIAFGRAGKDIAALVGLFLAAGWCNHFLFNVSPGGVNVLVASILLVTERQRYSSPPGEIAANDFRERRVRL